jgi:hypothetical protein
MGMGLMIDGYFNAQQMDKVQEAVDTLCAEVRTYAGRTISYLYFELFS